MVVGFLLATQTLSNEYDPASLSKGWGTWETILGKGRAGELWV